MDVINDLTSSLSSDLNSTELAKDLGLGFLAKSTAINGAVNLGIKLLEILFTLFLCWLMIRIPVSWSINSCGHRCSAKSFPCPKEKQKPSAPSQAAS